jgi:hypothetical protein
MGICVAAEFGGHGCVVLGWSLRFALLAIVRVYEWLVLFGSSIGVFWTSFEGLC